MDDMKQDKNESVKEEAVKETDIDETAENSSEQNENNSASEAVEEKAEKKSKKEKPDKKADKLQAKVDELEDKVKRQLAEFENYRRRTDNEKNAMFETGARNVIEKILPVIDNFERGLATVPEEEKNKPFADGMEMIYKQLMTELDKMDVKVIEAVGKEFDPNFHNAVMQVQNDELESGTVAQELQKGYTYRNVVVRHSMVAVVQ